MSKTTVSVDNWECPYCEQLQEFKGELAESCPLSELSGHTEILACVKCGKESTVSLSIEFRAEPVTS